MTDEKSAVDPELAAEPELPTAVIKPTATTRLVQSNLWWVTLLCFAVACFLAWQSQRPTGIEITIDFPEGHGLKQGDALRHRGIEIGVVTNVELTENLNQVRTRVAVDTSAEGIAIADSRFWIVRPQLSLTNISGLETAVGAKYIAVDPGPEESPRATEFQGLTEPPAIGIDNQGIEFHLRASESFGINPSSPVTYRGITVGQIVSVGLSDDAKFVDIVANVEKAYEPLLRESSRFWKTSGVDVDFGIRGFHLSTESLAAIAQGGVSFVTPKQRDEGEQRTIAPGHVFVLHGKVDPDWIDDAIEIKLQDAAAE